MSREICQQTLPLRPWAEDRTRRLPGTNPLDPADWLVVDEAYGAQMAYRDALLTGRPEAVLALTPEARPAMGELLDLVLSDLAAKPGFAVAERAVSCPDGRVVALDRTRPHETLGRLVQEDFVLLERPDEAGEHLVTGAVLCFPAHWTLAEKVLRPLSRVHGPVAEYDPRLAARVQRMFDGIRPEAPVMRANYLVYDDPDLFQPRRENTPDTTDLAGPLWLRVERQTMRRLPLSRAVVFSIHTYVLPFAALTPEDRVAVLAARAPAQVK